MADALTDRILLPGLLCDNAVCSPQLQSLRDVTRMVVPDLTRHDSIGDIGRAVLAAAPDHFSLAGFSMGGPVALEIYCQALDRVNCLALLNTGNQARAEDEAEQRDRRIGGHGDRNVRGPSRRVIAMAKKGGGVAGSGWRRPADVNTSRTKAAGTALNAGCAAVRRRAPDEDIVEWHRLLAE
jgi:pimeloyl-ACP methyl ester carboxylesterase